MTTYNGKIDLFDCATAQKIIGQENFLNAFKTILDHGAYCQGPETKELDQNQIDFFVKCSNFIKTQGEEKCKI